MAYDDDIETRLVDFAVVVIELTEKLPTTRIGDHLTGQLLRSGTSPAAYYAEAATIDNDEDAVHTLKLCAKELNETRIWLKIIGHSKMLRQDIVAKPLHECDELCQIIKSEIKTIKNKPNPE